MDYPVEDVVKNVRYFMNVVKRATGNIQDGAEKGRKENANKPCEIFSIQFLTFIANASSSHCYPESHLELGSGPWHSNIWRINLCLNKQDCWVGYVLVLLDISNIITCKPLIAVVLTFDAWFDRDGTYWVINWLQCYEYKHLFISFLSTLSVHFCAFKPKFFIIVCEYLTKTLHAQYHDRIAHILCFKLPPRRSTFDVFHHGTGQGHSKQAETESQNQNTPLITMVDLPLQ